VSFRTLTLRAEETVTYSATPLRSGLKHAVRHFILRDCCTNLVAVTELWNCRFQNYPFDMNLKPLR
jgi:hypothetical protein